MKVRKTSSGSTARFIPLQDRILSSVLASIRRAKQSGKSEHSMVLRNQPATHKALDILREHFDVSVQQSDSIKVTIKF